MHDRSEELMRAAYAAYGETTNFKNYQGLPMPEFDALPPAIKLAWRCAAQAVADSVRVEMEPSGEAIQEQNQEAAFYELRLILKEIADNDTENYELRYRLVLRAMSLAAYLGFDTGYRIDEKTPDWPVAFIELPTGQVTWHMPQHGTPFDGHDTPLKLERCRAFADGATEPIRDGGIEMIPEGH